MAARAEDPATVAAATERIETVLAALPDAQRAALQALREQIAAAAPEAVEAISYGMPAFRYHGRPLVSYAGWRTHCSFFPMGPEVLEANLADLAGYETAKGTIRFSPERPIPPAVVARIVHGRMAQIDAR
jgi:uncharacterized protein YdhG (YjbR/CyaY superfamily)